MSGVCPCGACVAARGGVGVAGRCGGSPGSPRLLSAIEAKLWCTAIKRCFQFQVAPVQRGRGSGGRASCTSRGRGRSTTPRSPWAPRPSRWRRMTWRAWTPRSRLLPSSYVWYACLHGGAHPPAPRASRSERSTSRASTPCSLRLLIGHVIVRPSRIARLDTAPSSPTSHTDVTLLGRCSALPHRLNTALPPPGKYSHITAVVKYTPLDDNALA